MQKSKTINTFNLNNLTATLVLSGICTITTLTLLYWIFSYSKYGFDFTDEGFYLVWIADPSSFKWSISQFGFIYNPLYIFLDGNIAKLRQLNIIITFTLAWILCSQILIIFSAKLKTQKRIAVPLLATGFACASLIQFDSWILTPNYNSLNLQSLLLTSIGIALTVQLPPKRDVWGYFVISLGGVFAFMAKPSTSALLALSVVAYFLITSKSKVRFIFTTTTSACTLFVLISILIDKSLHQFVERLKQGVRFATLLDGGHSINKIIRLDPLEFNHHEWIILITLTLILGIAAHFIKSDNRFKLTIALFITAFFLYITLTVCLGLNIFKLPFGASKNLTLLSIPFAAVAVRFKEIRSRHIPKQRWALAILFLTMPYTYAFGTNNNYWRIGSAAGIFWLLGGLILIAPSIFNKKNMTALIPLSIATIALVTGMLMDGMEKPYRQPQPLRINNTPIPIGNLNSKIILPAEYAKYIYDAMTAANLTAGTPIIDLSGQSPGLLYALNAKSIGQAWLIGGYPGSRLFTSTALSMTPCETLSAAWIIAEPQGPRSIPNDVTLTFGAHFPAEYKLVASWMTPKGAGGYNEPRIQKLYKPISYLNLQKSCHAVKTNKNDKLEK